MCFNMCAWCRYTRGRFERAQGGRFVHTHGWQGVIVSSAYQNLPTYGYHVIQKFTKETFGSFPLSSLRIDREQHVPDSSNHSLSLIKLFSFSCLEENKLLDCSVGLSPFCPSMTNDVNVSIATSLHQRVPLSGRVQNLSSPDTLCLTQNTFKITEYIHILVQKKTFAHTYTNTYSFTFTYLYICKYIFFQVVMNRHGHHNIRNGIVWAQTGHSTSTCTVSLHVIEL